MEREYPHLGNIKPSKVFFKNVLFYEEIEKISTAHIFKNLDEADMRSISLNRRN